MSKKRVVKKVVELQELYWWTINTWSSSNVIIYEKGKIEFTCTIHYYDNSVQNTTTFKTYEKLQKHTEKEYHKASF